MTIAMTCRGMEARPLDQSLVLEPRTRCPLDARFEFFLNTAPSCRWTGLDRQVDERELAQTMVRQRSGTFRLRCFGSGSLINLTCSRPALDRRTWTPVRSHGGNRGPSQCNGSVGPRNVRECLPWTCDVADSQGRPRCSGLCLEKLNCKPAYICCSRFTRPRSSGEHLFAY
jgi:hypothetical protein